MKWTEAEIQALKAQEAKDLAVEFLELLEAKDKGPISPGEVQLKELEFNLRLREAENCRPSPARGARETYQGIGTANRAGENACRRGRENGQRNPPVPRARHRAVAEATNRSAPQLERATRTHNLKLEQLTTEFKTKEEELSRQLRDLEQTRDALREEISTLTGLRGEAQEIGRLREEIDRRKKETRANTPRWKNRWRRPNSKKPSESATPNENSSSNSRGWKPSIRKTCCCRTDKRPRQCSRRWR